MTPSVRRLLDRVRRATVPEPAQLVPLDHPVHPRPRWGYGRPAHPELEALVVAAEDDVRATLTQLATYADELREIPLDPVDPDGPGPYWTNGWCQGLDAVSLYGTIAAHRPATYLEVGSGHSTRFARRAVDRHALRTRIVCIDPAPRASLAGLADEHVPRPLEDVDLAVFEQLAPGDVLAVDGSHRAFQNSDVTVLFCEVLPRLPAGVRLYVDDVFLPWDYPEQLAGSWWSEQYLLAAWLLAGDRLRVVLPNFWISTRPDLHRILDPVWTHLTWAGVPVNGTGFWLEVR
jgi:hypothetical protein